MMGVGRERDEIAEFAQGPPGVALQRAEQLMVDVVEGVGRPGHAAICAATAKISIAATAPAASVCQESRRRSRASNGREHRHVFVGVIYVDVSRRVHRGPE
jgi:hypothetical protein